MNRNILKFGGINIILLQILFFNNYACGSALKRNWCKTALEFSEIKRKIAK